MSCTDELIGDQRTRLHGAVEAFEKATGIEFCLIVGVRSSGNPEPEAQAMFTKLGLAKRAALLLVVFQSGQAPVLLASPKLHERVGESTLDQTREQLRFICDSPTFWERLEQLIGDLAVTVGSATAPTIDLRVVPDPAD